MLTAEELSWIELLTKSCVEVRAELNDGVSPSDNDLYHLINRAEALMFHLNKRTEQRDSDAVGE